MVSIKVNKKEVQANKTKSIGNVNNFNNLLKKDIKWSKAKFGDKKKERFFSELYLMVSSGLELNNALLIVIDFFKSKEDIELVRNLQIKISNGYSFHQAMIDSLLFSQYDCFSIKIGEETGQLEIILQELARYYLKKIQLRRQFVSALIYPSIVFCTAILAILFMMNFVIPMFAGVFTRFNTELPYITRCVIKISDFVRSWSMLGIFSLMFFGIIYSKFKTNIYFKKLTSFVLLRVPIFGKLLIKLYMARFCQSMKLLLSSKVHLIDALDLSSKMVNFYPLESILPLIKIDVMKGESLSFASEKYSIFDIKYLSMLKVGEEVNQLNRIYEKLEENYGNEVEHQTKVLTSMLEPILILFLGLMVGVILVAMYLPMFKLGYEIK